MKKQYLAEMVKGMRGIIDELYCRAEDPDLDESYLTDKLNDLLILLVNAKLNDITFNNGIIEHKISLIKTFLQNTALSPDQFFHTFRAIVKDLENECGKFEFGNYVRYYLTQGEEFIEHLEGIQAIVNQYDRFDFYFRQCTSLLLELKSSYNAMDEDLRRFLMSLFPKLVHTILHSLHYNVRRETLKEKLLTYADDLIFTTIEAIDKMAGIPTQKIPKLFCEQQKEEVRFV